jgi:hypothetical protein
MSCKELEAFEERIARLEKASGQKTWSVMFETDLWLPEADIDGLHFNEIRVHAVFERQDDGWFHSRDILFLSARSTVDECSRDILAEYLNSYDFIHSIWEQTPDSLFGKDVTPDDFTVGLPKKSEGIKRYNGAVCGYWLGTPFSDIKKAFRVANSEGEGTYGDAHHILGVAPAFYVGDPREA